MRTATTLVVKLMLVALAFAPAARAQEGEGEPVTGVLYVNLQNSSGIENGLAWETAYRTIQPALDAAIFLPNPEVWVARGVYGETRVPDGQLQLRSGVDLYGGFAGTEATRDARDIALNPTTINGAIANGGAPALRVVNGADDARIDGFIIRGGQGPAGGGMVNNGASPTIANCIFRDNAAQSYGGGMFNLGGASPTITNCVFDRNTAGIGGAGVASTGASPSFERCTFRDNDTPGNGGGAYHGPGANAAYTACLFRDNTATRGGGTFSASGAVLTLSKCKVLSNAATERGGGVANGDGSTANLLNVLFSGNESLVHGGALFNENVSALLSGCTLADNVAPTRGAAIYNTGNAQPLLFNTIVYNNFPEEIGNNDSARVFATNCIIRGGLSSGGNVGILTLDPLFSAPGSGDYSLQSLSPAIDTGVNTGTAPRGNVTDDLELDQRGFDGDGFGPTTANQADGSDFDIGHDEYTGEANIGDSSVTGADEGSLPGSGVSPFHTADISGDNVLSLSELLRLIQFYNSSGFQCADPPTSTEDGYVPGPGPAQACAAHASDYNPQDWLLSLSELLRAIQFYNSGGYRVCVGEGTEDGFCPGAGS